MAGERTLPGLGLKGFWDLGDNTYKAGMDANLRLLSALVQPRVLSVEATEPGAPTDGDLHIASALWGGAAVGDIVIRDNAAWVPVTPVSGWQAYNIATDDYLQFDGSTWAAASGGFFVGTYLTDTALTSAHPAPIPGSFAHVDAGAANDVQLYIWDNDDSAWVPSDAPVVAQTGTEIAALLDTEIGNADWRAGGGGGAGLSLVNDATADRILSNADLAGNVVIARGSATPQTVTINTGLTGTEPVTILNSGGGAMTFQGTATIQSAGAKVAVNTQFASVTLVPQGADDYYLVGALE